MRNYKSTRVKNLSPNSVFSNMTLVAQDRQPVNLALGAPDFPAPNFLKQAAIAAIQNDINQYASVRGLLSLRQAIANRMQNRHQITYNPNTEIIITQGATEAIFATMQGLIEPGDEVILFEPCYTTYLPAILLAGGIPRFYTLLPPNWRIDETKLSAMFSAKTKLIFINTPHNPTGKVFNNSELALIANLCQQYDVLALSDEVYADVIFDDKQHVPLCTYPGMYERTITVSTFGKTFGVTGWKVGWTIAPSPLAEAIMRIHEYTCGSGTAPMQEAAAQVLTTTSVNFYTDIIAQYTAKRNYLCDILNKSGLKPIVPYGTYFLMANFFGFVDDIEFCNYLSAEIGITAIPASSLYHNKLPSDIKLVRFAFCKKQETLKEAGMRLLKMR
ncbi:hypothetical protein TI05_08395 [Achromatium sp. WMS3]|nr:hypothetical protein TI05_08395 [Achromatium sp. WMS3]